MSGLLCGLMGAQGGNAFALQKWTVPSVHPLRVVIDPGHGGMDYGSLFQEGPHQILEKNLTLRLSLHAMRELKKQGIEVALTRASDRDISLAERTAFANRWKADLFISIHMNSTINGAASEVEGIETYILNHTTDESSRRLARLENGMTFFQKQGNISTDVSLILKDLILDANLPESQYLACRLQTHLVLATSPGRSRFRRNRGVKQALFHVLLGADMPSVLVEAGFMNHAQDRARVLSPYGVSRMAKALTEAILEYRTYQNLGKNGRRTLAGNACKLAPTAP